MKKEISNWILAALLLVFGSSLIVQSQISGLSGLAVAQTLTPIQWNNVRDGAAGATLSGGTLAATLFQFDGLDLARITGTAANGIDVDVTRIAGGAALTDAFANPTDALITGSFGMIFNGTTWDRWITDDAAGGSNANANGMPIVELYARNPAGTTHDRVAGFGNNIYVGVHGAGQLRAGMITQQITSAATTATSITIVAGAGSNTRLYGIDARCDTLAATTNGITVTNEGAAATLWSTSPRDVTDTNFSKEFTVALTNPTIDNDIIVNLAACSAGTGTLMVRGDRQGQ